MLASQKPRYRVESLKKTVVEQKAFLGSPETALEIREFNIRHDVVLHYDLAGFYQLCSGLKIPDVWLISLWPLHKIQRVEDAGDEGDMFAIGDLMIDSDEIVTDIADPKSVVRLRASSHVLSSSVTAFLDALARGQLES